MKTEKYIGNKFNSRLFYYSSKTIIKDRRIYHGLLQYYYTNNNYSCIIHFYRGRKKGFSLIKNSFYGN